MNENNARLGAEQVGEALDAARQAWRERVQAERQQDRERQEEQHVGEEPEPAPEPPQAEVLVPQEVAVPWPCKEDDVTIEAYQKFVTALLAKTWTFDRFVFDRSHQNSRGISAAVYKRKIKTKLPRGTWRAMGGERAI